MFNKLIGCSEQLYVKPSKCFFGVQEVEYLGHIVSHEGVKADPNKIKAIKEWRIPTTLRHLRGFLGLTRYYHKFVKNDGRIVAPLTTLLKKDAFSWTLEAMKAFENLKEAMCRALVLATLVFTKTFIVEDTSKSKQTMIVLNTFWNKDYLQKSNKNGSQKCWVMTLK